MEKPIKITKAFIKDLKLSSFYNNCSKIEHFWSWDLGGGKNIEFLTRYRFYLDKNGNKKTSANYYQKRGEKWEQTERYVENGFTFPETLSNELKRIQNGEQSELYYYPKELSGHTTRSPVKKPITRKIYRTSRR